MKKPRTDLLADEQGSIFVEFVFFMPVIILIWILLTFTYNSKKVSTITQKDARSCAWHYALNGCNGSLPAQCRSGGVSNLSDTPLRIAATGSFELLTTAVPGTYSNYKNGHGRYFSLKSEQGVQRPSILGGTTTAKGVSSIACGDEAPKKWTTSEMARRVCVTHGVSYWCP